MKLTKPIVLLAFLLFQAACSGPSMPKEYKVKFDTSKGPFTVEVHRDWAPIGADRFYNLVRAGFYDDSRFFRVTARFAQFGIAGAPEIAAIWRDRSIKDDPVKETNTRGGIRL